MANYAVLTAPDTSLSRLAPKTGAEKGPVIKPDSISQCDVPWRNRRGRNPRVDASDLTLMWWEQRAHGVSWGNPQGNDAPTSEVATGILGGTLKLLAARGK
jgi:hypothetical protein